MSEAIGNLADNAPKRVGRAMIALAGGTVLMLAVFWTHLLYEIAQIRNSDIASARRDAANLAIAAQEMTAKVFLEAEHHLRWIKREFERKGDDFDLVAYFHTGHGLKDISTYVGIYDAKGNVLGSSMGAADPRNGIGDRDYFVRLAEMEGDPFLIAQPMLGKTSGKWIIPVSVRRTTPAGGFAGVVVTGISVDHILNFYRAFNLGKQGSLALLHTDGTAMARLASGKSMIGANFASDQVFRQAARQPHSVFEERGEPGTAGGRLVGYRSFDELPLLIAVGLSLDDVLADFHSARRDLLIQGMIVSAAILIFAGAALFLLRRQSAGMAAVERAEGAARDAYRRLVGIIDGASDLIAALDQQFRFLVFNRRYAEEFERLFARRIKPGQSLIDALADHPEEQKRALEVWGRALDGESFTTVREMGAPHLDNRVFEMTYSPLRDADGHPSGAIHVMRDATDHAVVECELRRSNTELERLSVMMSQDVANGLRKLAVLLAQIKEKPEADGRDERFLSAASSEVSRLLQMTDGLSEYLHFQKRNVPLGNVDLRQCCSRALSALSGTIRENSAEIVVGQLPAVIGDAEQLVWLFRHLVDNAIRNRRPGRAPNIHLSAERKNGSWVIGVHDNGVGIASADLPKLFTAFQHVHPHKDEDGLGLGLAICRSIVTHHGGRIWAESIPGQGSVFYFSLPAAAIAMEKAAE